MIKNPIKIPVIYIFITERKISTIEPPNDPPFNVYLYQDLRCSLVVLNIVINFGSFGPLYL
jgi:hypothetical protein